MLYLHCKQSAMAVHKMLLNDFFEEEQFTLIGIHCTIEDFRLAYLLNGELQVNLNRMPEDLDHNNKATYSIYEWKDEQQQIQWNLVSNFCKVEIEDPALVQSSLFNTKQSTTQIYQLIPEHKKVNYMLKIGSKIPVNKEKVILNKILSIPQVVTAYSINTNQLKSKDNLIFN